MSLRYQPIVRLADGCTVGFETLCAGGTRSTGSSRRRVPPACGENGVLLPITRWVLRSACVEARRWDRASPPGAGDGVGVTVNLSPADLQNPRFVDEVESALELSGLLRPGSRSRSRRRRRWRTSARALRTMRDLRRSESDSRSTTSAPVTRRSRTSASSRSIVLKIAKTVRRPPRRRAGRHDVRRRDPPARPCAGDARRSRKASRWSASRTSCSPPAAISARATGSRDRCCRSPFRVPSRRRGILARRRSEGPHHPGAEPEA